MNGRKRQTTGSWIASYKPIETKQKLLHTDETQVTEECIEEKIGKFERREIPHFFYFWHEKPSISNDRAPKLHQTIIEFSKHSRC